MTCEVLVGLLGKDRPVADLETSDFEKLRTDLAETRGAHALAGVIQRIRTLFKYAWDVGIIDKPIRFGTVFRKPSKKSMRKARNDAGTRMIEAEDFRKLLATASTPLKAMILLGLNCGFGQTDVANLPFIGLDGDRAPVAIVGRR